MAETKRREREFLGHFEYLCFIYSQEKWNNSKNTLLLQNYQQYMLVAYVISLGGLHQKSTSFEVCILPHLPRFQVSEIEALSIRKNFDHQAVSIWKRKSCFV